MQDKKIFLAVDIGASSGRHIAAWRENSKIEQREIYRFDNGAKKCGKYLCWDIEALENSVIEGLKTSCAEGLVPTSVGIDTWGVDFVLLDENGERIGDTVAYRDERTEGMDEKVYELIPESELYAQTGIQKQLFNTIYQLMALKQQEPELLEKAHAMLLMPDYLHYVLCGEKATEYTNATTTQLINPKTRDWHWELIDKLGYPRRIFQKIVQPGTKLGTLKPELAEKIGASFDIIAPATHDTGSAVLAVPFVSESGIYISSGTWSLMGVELSEADCSEKSKECNFTNEGGYAHTIRYLKNIMGLWMIQSVRNELGREFSFAQLCEMAEKEDNGSRVDCNDDRFLAPESMIEEVKAACRESGQAIPETPGELAAVIYNSLAICYREAAEELEQLTGKKYSTINIVGGGSNADYLNRLTAKETGRTVYAGPAEGTALGNICAQMITYGELADAADARKHIYNSTDIKVYE